MPYPPLTLRADIAEPLDVQQHDDNHRRHEGRIDDILANPPDANGIAGIVQLSATTFKITLDDSTQFTLTLPIAEPVWRGDWAAATSYFAYDLVVVAGVGVYRVLQDHTSAGSFDAAASNSDGPYYVHVFGIVTGTPYDFTLVLAATPGAGDIVDRLPILRDIRIPANFSGALASGVTPPDDYSDFTGYVISIRDDGSEIGTVTIGAAGDAAFATAGGAAKDIDAGSLLSAVAPDDGSDQDASIANWIFAIKASIR